MRSAIKLCATVLSLVTLAAPGFAQTASDYCKISDRAALFLADQTTPLGDADRKQLLGYLAKVVDGLKVGDALMVATIKGHYTDSENLGGGCMPGCPAAHGAVAALLGKCDAVQTRSNEIAFKKSLADGVRALGKSTSKTDKSAIVETIARRTQEFPYKDKLTDLYIFSDMMENSVLLPWKKFSGMSSDQILTLMKDSGVLPDVKGANVTIIGFGRSQAAGRPGLPPDVDSKLRLVWTDILKGAGANGVTFVSANQ